MDFKLNLPSFGTPKVEPNQNYIKEPVGFGVQPELPKLVPVVLPVPSITSPVVPTFKVPVVAPSQVVAPPSIGLVPPTLVTKPSVPVKIGPPKVKLPNLNVPNDTIAPGTIEREKSLNIAFQPKKSDREEPATPPVIYGVWTQYKGMSSEKVHSFNSNMGDSVIISFIVRQLTETRFFSSVHIYGDRVVSPCRIGTGKESATLEGGKLECKKLACSIAKEILQMCEDSSKDTVNDPKGTG